jgi:hypothetical protein
MKISLDDLKKAVQWIEGNSRDVNIRVELDPNGRNLILKCDDKLSVNVEITLYADSTMKPRIKKEDAL